MESPQPRWPALVVRLCRPLAPGLAAESAPARREARAEAWILLRDALLRFLRSHAARHSASREDLEDLASAKALDLVTRAELGEWSLEGRSAAEVGGYLSSVARNALLDRAARTRRVATLHTEMDPADDEREITVAPRAAATPAPERSVEAREFAGSLRDCVGGLQPRARRVWFFRVLYEMTSREIALHPHVRLDAAHVDVIVKRARDAIRDCMSRKGLEPADMPAGMFVELWESLESLGATEAPVAVEALP